MAYFAVPIHGVGAQVPQATVSGTIRAADGTPVPGLEVAAGQRTTTTDGSGRYQVVVDDGSSIELSFRTDHRLRADLPDDFYVSEYTTLHGSRVVDLQLPPTVQIAVQVANTAIATPGAVHVDLTDPLDFAGTGGATFAGSSSSRPVAVDGAATALIFASTQPGEVRATEEAGSLSRYTDEYDVPLDPDHTVQLDLGRAVHLSGVLRSADRSALAGLPLTARTSERSADGNTYRSSYDAQSTASDGSYTAIVLAGRPLSITVSTVPDGANRPTDGLPRADIDFTAPPAADDTLDVTLPATRTIAITAVDAAGRPVDPDVSVDPVQGENFSSEIAPNVTATGSVVATDPVRTGPGAYSATVFVGTTTTALSAVLTRGDLRQSMTQRADTSTQFVFAASVTTLSGVIRDGAGNAVPGVKMNASSGPPPRCNDDFCGNPVLPNQSEVTTGADGRYSLDVVDGAETLLTVIRTATQSAGGLPATFVMRNIEIGEVTGATNIDLTLPPTSTVTEHSVDGRGAPVVARAFHLSSVSNYSYSPAPGLTATLYFDDSAYGADATTATLVGFPDDSGTLRAQTSTGSAYGTGQVDSGVDADVDVVAVSGPSAPRSIVAVATSSTSVDVSWQPPTDDGGAPITEYDLYAVPTYGGARAFVTLAGDQTHATLDGLAPGTLYAIYVYAANAFSSGGGDSTSITTTTPAGGAATTVALTSSANPSGYGQPATITASVAAGADPVPDGTVVFTVDGVPGTAQPAGSATLDLSTLDAGDHTVAAQYSGTTTYASSQSDPVVQHISRRSTTTTLATSATTSVTGQPVTFIATTTAPSGSITFTVDGAPTTVAIAGGQAKLSRTDLAVGTHAITAHFDGTTNYAASTSTGVSEKVQRAATTTSLTAAPNPAAYGSSVAFTASVAAVAPGGGIPTGTVTFTVDGVAQSPVALDSGGQAVLTRAGLSVGSHRVTAAFAATSAYKASSAPAVTERITKGATSTSVTSSTNPSVLGQPVVFTATVTGAPSGSVTFSVDGAVQATVSLSGGAATYSTSSLAVGTHRVIARYVASTNYAASASPTLTQSITKAATTTSVSSSANPAARGTTVRLTATVAATAPGSGTPSGAVTFVIDGVTAGSATLANGRATYSTSGLAVGQHTIVARYATTASYLASQSPTLRQRITP